MSGRGIRAELAGSVGTGGSSGARGDAVGDSVAANKAELIASNSARISLFAASRAAVASLVPSEGDWSNLGAVSSLVGGWGGIIGGAGIAVIAGAGGAAMTVLVVCSTVAVSRPAVAKSKTPTRNKMIKFVFLVAVDWIRGRGASGTDVVGMTEEASWAWIWARRPRFITKDCQGDSACRTGVLFESR